MVCGGGGQSSCMTPGTCTHAGSPWHHGTCTHAGSPPCSPGKHIRTPCCLCVYVNSCCLCVSVSVDTVAVFDHMSSRLSTPHGPIQCCPRLAACSYTYAMALYGLPPDEVQVGYIVYRLQVRAPPSFAHCRSVCIWNGCVCKWAAPRRLCGAHCCRRRTVLLVLVVVVYGGVR